MARGKVTRGKKRSSADEAAGASPKRRRSLEELKADKDKENRQQAQEERHEEEEGHEEEEEGYGQHWQEPEEEPDEPLVTDDSRTLLFKQAKTQNLIFKMFKGFGDALERQTEAIDENTRHLRRQAGTGQRAAPTSSAAPGQLFVVSEPESKKQFEGGARTHLRSSIWPTENGAVVALQMELPTIAAAKAKAADYGKAVNIVNTQAKTIRNKISTDVKENLQVSHSELFDKDELDEQLRDAFLEEESYLPAVAENSEWPADTRKLWCFSVLSKRQAEAQQLESMVLPGGAAAYALMALIATLEDEKLPDAGSEEFTASFKAMFTKIEKLETAKVKWAAVPDAAQAVFAGAMA